MTRIPSSKWVPAVVAVAIVVAIIGFTLQTPRQVGAPETPSTTEPVPGGQTGVKPADGKGACQPAGCSGQICADADTAGDIVTTCEYRADYACYQGATCERQTNGECGWTQSASLVACLKNPPPLQ